MHYLGRMESNRYGRLTLGVAPQQSAHIPARRTALAAGKQTGVTTTETSSACLPRGSRADTYSRSGLSFGFSKEVCIQ